MLENAFWSLGIILAFKKVVQKIAQSCEMLLI